MILKITAIADDKLGSADAKRIEGTRVDNGESWSKKFFADNKVLRQQLEEFGVGEHVKIKLKQNPKNQNWWDIVSFSAASAEEVSAIQGKGKSGSPMKSTGGGKTGGKSSGGLSKEEWAEKDRKAKIGMSIHNAVAAASRLCKVGSKPETVIEYAKELLPFLLEDEIPTDVLVKIDEPFGGGADPLDPPIDD